MRWSAGTLSQFQQIVVLQAPFALLNLVNHGNEPPGERTINPEIGANICREPQLSALRIAIIGVVPTLIARAWRLEWAGISETAGDSAGEPGALLMAAPPSVMRPSRLRGVRRRYD